MIRMDSRLARKLFYQHASALAYVDVETSNEERHIGAAFHIGEGTFVTARHVVEGNRIEEVKITEPAAINSTEYFRDIRGAEVTDEYLHKYDEIVGEALQHPPLFKHWMEPLQITEGPFFASNEALDVAVFRVAKLHPAAGIVKLGIHWDDWIHRGFWHLSDAIVLGYPPIPMVNSPELVAARAEINTYVFPRHAPAVHFILSGMPRGGFSGGVAIHETGYALGVVTASLVSDGAPEQLGFLAVLSIEAIMKCLEENDLLPEVQRQHQAELLRPRSSRRIANKG